MSRVTLSSNHQPVVVCHRQIKEMKINELTPRGSRLLQPLREIGLPTKTQSWDIDDIQAALREAYCQGIAVESLYGTAVPRPTGEPSDLGPSRTH